MNPQMTFQRVCAIAGVITPILFFGAFIAAGFIPPLAPSASAGEIAAHYREHASGIRLGAGIMLLSGAFYAAYTAVISAQMQRIPGVHQAVINTQLAAGAFACLTFLVPAMFFASSVFRPDRSPDLTLLLNDMSWIFLVMPWPPFMAQNFAFAFDPVRQTAAAGFSALARLPQRVGAHHLHAGDHPAVLQVRPVRLERHFCILDPRHRLRYPILRQHRLPPQGDQSRRNRDQRSSRSALR
jgi:hypothetical protein